MNGILENAAEPPCPVCGQPLGYYAELGDETECEHCGTKLQLERVTEIHYEVTEIGTKVT